MHMVGKGLRERRVIEAHHQFSVYTSQVILAASTMQDYC